MIYLLTGVYVLVCVFLIAVVLLQTGKRADLAGAFGGGGSQTAFGARGAATFLSKATTASAVLFMITALALSIATSRRSAPGSVLDQVPAPESAPVTAPAAETPDLDLPPLPAATDDDAAEEPIADPIVPE